MVAAALPGSNQESAS